MKRPAFAIMNDPHRLCVGKGSSLRLSFFGFIRSIHCLQDYSYNKRKSKESNCLDNNGNQIGVRILRPRTAVRTTIPITSSMIAALIIVVPTSVDIFPSSFNT